MCSGLSLESRLFVRSAPSHCHWNNEWLAVVICVLVLSTFGDWRVEVVVSAGGWWHAQAEHRLGLRFQYAPMKTFIDVDTTIHSEKERRAHCFCKCVGPHVESEGLVCDAASREPSECSVDTQSRKDSCLGIRLDPPSLLLEVLSGFSVNWGFRDWYTVNSSNSRRQPAVNTAAIAVLVIIAKKINDDSILSKQHRLSHECLSFHADGLLCIAEVFRRC